MRDRKLKISIVATSLHLRFPLLSILLAYTQADAPNIETRQRAITQANVRKQAANGGILIIIIEIL